MTSRELIIAIFPSISDFVVHSIKIYFRAFQEIEKGNLYRKINNNTLGLQRAQLALFISLVIGHNCPSHLLHYFLASALIFFILEFVCL